MSPPTGPPSPSGTSPSGTAPLGGSSDRLVNIYSYPSAWIHLPQRTSPSGTSPSGNPPLGESSDRLVSTNLSSSAGTDPHSGDWRQPQQPQQIMSDMFLPYIRYLEQIVDHGMDTAALKDEEETASKPSSSVEPSQPLAGGPAIGAALHKTASASRGRRNRDHDPAQKLRELIAASRQVEASIKVKAEKATATSQDPAHRPEERDRTTSKGSQTNSGKGTKTDQRAPDADSMNLTEEKPHKNRPTKFEEEQKQDRVSIPHTQRGPRNPRGRSQKATTSPADFEMLRLKDRQTLHRLKRS